MEALASVSLSSAAHTIPISSSRTLSRTRPITDQSQRSGKLHGTSHHLIRNRGLLTLRASAINDVSTAVANPAQVEITWQIVVGSIAGVTPFVVAGIEFSKRIVEQRRCEVCGGSGLVLREKDYFKCPGCGGFLPWQSWKRFFSG